MTDLQIAVGGLAAGVLLTVLAQVVAHRVQVWRLNRKWARWRQGNGHLPVTWPAPEPAAPPGSLIIEPVRPEDKP